MILQAARSGADDSREDLSKGGPKMVIDSHSADHPHTDDQVRDMKRLLERAEQFADTVRDEIAVLDSMREEALAEVQREADVIRAEAANEAQRIRAQAEDDARETKARGHSEAADITEAAYEDLGRIEQVLRTYREAVETARTLFGELPEAPSPASMSADGPDHVAPSAHSTADGSSPNGEGRDRVGYDFRPAPGSG